MMRIILLQVIFTILQGCMNNVTFGDGNVGYYETVAGGAGAVSAYVVPVVNLPVYLIAALQ